MSRRAEHFRAVRYACVLSSDANPSKAHSTQIRLKKEHRRLKRVSPIQASMRQIQLFSEIGGTCEKLLHELDLIWNEVGEDDAYRQKILFEMQQECLDIFQRKVDQASRSRSNFHIMLADIHSEIVSLASALGDNIPMAQLEKRDSSLKVHLAKLDLILKQMSSKKEERLRMLQETRTHIQKIQSEISPSPELLDTETTVVDDHIDLTQRKVEELQFQLQALQREKNNRIYKVMEYVDVLHSLCTVLGFDFFAIVGEVHPTLDESSTTNPVKSISNDTLTKLSNTIDSLKEEKKNRMGQIQDLGASLLELWNLMDTPVEEQHRFQHVTSNIASAEHEIITPGTLSLNVIEEAKAEVKRLEDLKTSKLTELVLRKQKEFQEISKKSHITLDSHTDIEKTISSIESGMVDPAQLLLSLEEEIGNLKEEAFSRKDILEKVEKWMTFREEENWLEEYSKDENRYNSTRGAHLNLMRAERARVAVGKIPALVDSLVLKTVAWEEERRKPFLYDGINLRSMVEDYKIMRMEKEEERRRNRDQKKLHEQSVNEQETSSGSKPSQNARTPSKKGVANSRSNGNSAQVTRRLSLHGGGMTQQEALLLAKPNGTTPVRNGSSAPNKDIRFNSPGSNINQPSSEIAAESTLPFLSALSPVFTPDTSCNTIDEGFGLASILPIKTSVIPRRSSISTTLTPRKSSVATALLQKKENIEIEEENEITDTEEHGKKLIQEQVNIQAIQKQVNTQHIQEQAIPPQVMTQQDPEFHRSMEYSFEENRLAFVSHYQLQKC